MSGWLSPAELKFLYLSWQGRINGQRFLFGILLLAPLILTGAFLPWIGPFLIVFALAASLPLTSKRLEDIGLSIWIYIVFLFLFIGGYFLLNVVSAMIGFAAAGDPASGFMTQPAIKWSVLSAFALGAVLFFAWLSFASKQSQDKV